MAGFPWTDAAGKPLSFIEAADFPEGEEGRFGPGRLANRYFLDTPLTPRSGTSIELDLRLNASTPTRIKLSLFRDSAEREPAFEQELTLRDPRTLFAIPLATGSPLAGFGLTLAEALGGNPGDAPCIDLAGVALIRGFRGYERAADYVRLSADFRLARKGEKLYASLGGGLPLGLDAEGNEVALLRLAYAGKGDGFLELSAPKTRKLTQRLKPGAERVAFPLTLFEPSLESLELVLPASVELRGFSLSLRPAGEAEAVDLGVVLRARAANSAADFDLYRWNLLPEVLVFDFRDYATQDRYLKRLAFFVEKKGFKGRLAPNEEIQELHGWNAHDYRVEDLVNFFRAARESSFPLNSEERRLEAVLIERGLLREEGRRLEPGRGAIISISRESPAYLRATFLTHEASHALVFVDADFRDFVAASWAAVPEEERWFWKLYFGWMNYDTSDPYLMANEFMAYLFQQPSERVEEYFTQNLPARLLERHPELAPRIAEYMERYGKNFVIRAARIEDWLYRKYGLRAGQAYFLD